MSIATHGFRLATLLALAAPLLPARAAAQAPPPVAPVAPVAAPAASADDDAGLARAARAALGAPGSERPWVALASALRHRRRRLGFRRPDAAERAAAAVAREVAPAGEPGGVGPAAAPADVAPELTGLRIDGDSGIARLTVRAPGARFYVAPPIIEPDVTRLLVDLPGARSAIGGLHFPRAGDGPVLGIAGHDDGDGAHLEIFLTAGARFRALRAAGGLVIEIEDGGSPASTWTALAPGTPPVAPLRPLPDASAFPLPGHAAAGSGPALVAALVPAAPGPAALRGPVSGARLTAPALARTAPTGRAGREAEETSGPLSSSQRLLLLFLVAMPPVLAIQLLRRRAPRSQARPGTASASASATAPRPPVTVSAPPAVPASARRSWLRRSAPKAPAGEPAARLWAARTLTATGAAPADVARRTGLSRDALALLARSARA